MRAHAGFVLCAALLFAGVALLFDPGPGQYWIGLVSLLLGCSSLWILVVSHIDKIARRRLKDSVRTLTGHDAAATIMTDLSGEIIYCNDAAADDYKVCLSDTLEGSMRFLAASPSALLSRLKERADTRGSAYEDVVAGHSQVRLSVHRVGFDMLVWRIDRIAEKAVPRNDAVPLAMLTVGGGNAIVFMNDAARSLFGDLAGKLDLISPKLPMISGEMNDIRTRSGMQSCLIVEQKGLAGRRDIYVVPSIESSGRAATGWTLFDELPVALLKLTRDGTIRLCNKQASDLLGCKAWSGRQITELLEGLGRSIPDWLEDAALARGALHSEFLRVRRADKEIFIQVTLNRAIEGGETVLIAVLNDATRLKSLEAQFVQSQKMQAIGQLAGGIAHDFNNLLTAISGHCDLLLLRHDQGDSDYNDLLQIAQNANRAAALVNQLLAYSRKQTLRPEMMDLRDAMSDLTHLLNRLVGENVTLSLNHDPTLWSIRADKRQFEQVIMNLVVNARDSMTGGGVIRVETENITYETAMHRDRAVVAPGKWVKISVTDEGAGIPQDRLEKVFEPFFTTKKTGEGTGLGLSTAYGIVKQTGGFIFVDSKCGKGTTFFLMFPAYESVVPRVDKPQIATVDNSPTEGIILLVEDEAPVRAFASRALQMRGFTVLEAETGEEALSILADQDLKVDIFVTDVAMPGLDGPSWVKQARGLRPHVRVVFVSGYAQEDFADTQARIPNSVFLSKPFSLIDLTETVQQQLR